MYGRRRAFCDTFSVGQAEQVAEKTKTPSFRGTLRAEESLFYWI
jgi:hypothetical protein